MSIGRGSSKFIRPSLSIMRQLTSAIIMRQLCSAIILIGASASIGKPAPLTGPEAVPTSPRPTYLTLQTTCNFSQCFGPGGRCPRLGMASMQCFKTKTAAPRSSALPGKEPRPALKSALPGKETTRAHPQ